ncbi:hypothetical protein [Cellvibrio sp. UBA7671]|uniref:hypothetical protein n=1 Tax=Cellvibrio sp. UBA7671 TaxID=1946312 RepID=UPI002F352098
MKTFGPKLQNSTFRGDHDRSEMNACVGQNGQPDYPEYANGFSVAATILLDKVVGAHEGEFLKYNLDELIYPIAFTMRHAVELRLKHTTNYLHLLAVKTDRKIENFNHSQQHDIGAIFDYVAKAAISIDERYRPHIQTIAPFIGDIAEVDPTGQTFRYPYDNTGSNKHLEDVSLINIYVLQDRFLQLEKLLWDLHELNRELIQEYNEKSFTRKLSRLQLFELAKLLPPYDRWKDDSFDEVRQHCRDLFGISNKELSGAINIIKVHYELAPFVHISVPLQAAQEADFIIFFDNWTKLHFPSSMGNIVSSKSLYEKVIENVKASADAVEEIEKYISPDAIADIQAVFELARYPIYSEYYVRVYRENKILLRRNFESSRQSYRDDIDYIVSKTNAFENILKGLYRLNQLQLATLLEQRYSAHVQDNRLEIAREGSLFQPHPILNYGAVFG